MHPMIQDINRKKTHTKSDSHTRIYVLMSQKDSQRKGKIESEEEVLSVGLRQTQMASLITWRTWSVWIG